MRYAVCDFMFGYHTDHFNLPHMRLYEKWLIASGHVESCYCVYIQNVLSISILIMLAVCHVCAFAMLERVLYIGMAMGRCLKLSQCAIQKSNCHIGSVIMSDDRGSSRVANGHDFTKSVDLYYLWYYYKGRQIFFKIVLVAILYSIICFINIACLIRSKTSVAEGYKHMNEVENHHSFKIAACHTVMPSLNHLSR